MNLQEQMMKIITDASRISTNESILQQHGTGLTYHEGKLPDIVVYPKEKEEVQEIVRFADANEIPIVPFGVGSSLEGQTIPQHGGISLDFSQMNEIISVDAEDFIAVVQPGVTRGQLNEHLKNKGLFFPVDPGVDATIGGMTATNASGTNSVKYGVTRDQILALEVVLADGRIIKSGSHAMKSSSGYSLKDLFIGSEGTLGIFTEITLRLHGIPEEHLVARTCFSTIDQAGTAALQMLQSGIPIGKLELVDADTIEAVNKYLQLDFPIAHSLFIECSGSKQEVTEQIKVIQEIAKLESCKSFDYESDTLGKSTLWDARHQAGMAIAAAHPGKKLMSTDVCVPISSLPEAIMHARQVVEENEISASIFGHVGDGNFHVVLAIDLENPSSLDQALAINEKIVQNALHAGGTCSGEHGIGTGKRQYLTIEHGKSLQVMKELKTHFDPKNILNPGILIETNN